MRRVTGLHLLMRYFALWQCIHKALPFKNAWLETYDPELKSTVLCEGHA